jgi:hypothetical protein
MGTYYLMEIIKLVTGYQYSVIQCTLSETGGVGLAPGSAQHLR